MRRVVVTGMGIVCPLGVGLEPVWRRLINGRSGIRVVNCFNADLPSRIAGEVGFTNAAGIALGTGGDRPGSFARIAAGEALRDAGVNPAGDLDPCMMGVSVGSGCGGFESLYEAACNADPLAGAPITRSMVHAIATDLADAHNLLGPRRAVSTACSSGAHAVGDAARIIAFGDADIMLAGGTEAAVNELGMAGFSAARALSTGFNDEPSQASRPWDRERDGFVMGEGAGMLVLEALDHARQRGARIHAELVGYGMSGDGWHITSPNENGDGAFRAMRHALRHAGLVPEQVDYINAHGTSTPMGDDIELVAVERLFRTACGALAMSSTKSSIGHLLGASGAVEAIFSVLAIRDGVAPPTLNLSNPSRASAINRVAKVAQERRIRVAMSNSFGFGGTNASLAFRAM